MPRIDAFLHQVGQACFHSTWEISLQKYDKEKTAFPCPLGLYHFIKMLFGLRGAAASFQRLMDGVLQPVADFALTYLDDIMVFSNSWLEHLVHLQRLL